MTPGAPAPTIPNTGRILDYWLGGRHHFPADAAAADAFAAIYAEFPHVFRGLRAFIGRLARRMRAEGIEQFLVLGAGIPTQGNVHEAVPGARVLYTDVDPLNVELGAAIVAGTPGVGYARCDVADLATLDSPTVGALLEPTRPTGIVVVGVAVFIPDDRLAAAYAALHAWAAPGSLLGFDFDGREMERHPAALALLGDGFHMRAPATFAPLLGRWRLTREGIRPVVEWGASGASEATPALPVFMYGGLAAR